MQLQSIWHVWNVA